MKPKTPKMLPKTLGEIDNGGLYHQAVRCGKAACHCSTGKLHYGYYYFIRRIGGKLKKTYVRKSQVDEMLLLIQQSRNIRRKEREIQLTSRNLLSELRARLRQHDVYIRDLVNVRKQNG